MLTPSVSPCNLCPRNCNARRASGQKGVCGADDRVILARAALHMWEEPPLSGKRGSGALFFTHCPLHCVFCQNKVIADGEAGRSVSIDRLAEICLELQRQGALNVNCVTPTHYSLAIAEAISTARDSGLDLPVVWNTSGYERPEIIRWLSGTVDVYLDDFKYISPYLAKRYSKAEDYAQVALDALDVMLETVGAPRYDEIDGEPRLIKGVVVRHLMLPQALEDSKIVLRVLYERYGNDVLYSIMNQYTPVMSEYQLKNYPELASRVPDQEYERLLDFADSLGMDDYFWQEGPAALESFIPAWDCSGV